MISAENICMSFHRTEVLHNLSFSLSGEKYGLLGTNGAGKTTLIRCLCGVYTPTRGVVQWNGQDIRKSRTFKQSLGYLPQSFGMFPELTLFEMLSYFCAMKGITEAEREKQIRMATTQVNLEDKWNMKVKKLSGGMLRRAGIAQALLGEPDILVFDEPTSGLDPEERVRFKNILHNVKEDRTVIISTHIVEDIETTCNNVIVIDEGQIVFSGTCSELQMLARNKVFIVPEEYELPEGANILKSYTLDGRNYSRVLADASSLGDAVPPSLEDGYICLIKHVY